MQRPYDVSPEKERQYKFSKIIGNRYQGRGRPEYAAQYHQLVFALWIAEPFILVFFPIQRADDYATVGLLNQGF
ncbi:Uncharacterised protein [Serratia fonticola]|uniref:Uncharacterized protein n=1 Tax=Serratia fonticola TaxID=47917 RepID=A0A4U9U4W2_SERFO|nr:Uncharacterised protein [Serratia fonticola]